MRTQDEAEIVACIPSLRRYARGLTSDRERADGPGAGHAGAGLGPICVLATAGRGARMDVRRHAQRIH